MSIFDGVSTDALRERLKALKALEEGAWPVVIAGRTGSRREVERAKGYQAQRLNVEAEIHKRALLIRMA